MLAVPLRTLRQVVCNNLFALQMKLAVEIVASILIAPLLLNGFRFRDQVLSLEFLGAQKLPHAHWMRREKYGSGVFTDSIQDGVPSWMVEIADVVHAAVDDHRHLRCAFSLRLKVQLAGADIRVAATAGALAHRRVQGELCLSVRRAVLLRTVPAECCRRPVALPAPSRLGGE
eukprot:SAG31_NODE_2835_length_5019_cov_2.618293_4_plen_173_part_00